MDSHTARSDSRTLTAVAAAITLLSHPVQAAEDMPFVVAKVQLVFSVVTHYCHNSDRIFFYNTEGSPAGNTNYAVPFLVCDPLVTLYNPGNTSVTRSTARVGIWDPPVGFKFKKNAIDLRPEFAAGDGFLPMARFQIQNENNPSARKSFTLLLRDPAAGGAPGAPITLGPGESKTFSAWVEDNWTWGLETAGGFVPRSFYDWNGNENFSNVDGRTNNLRGVEALPGWDPRAGFQTDHLSTSGGRPLATLYDFETANHWNGAWVAIKQSDTFSVAAKAVRAVNQPALPDFRVSLMGGNVVNPEQDMLRDYPMALSGLIQDDPQTPVVQRTFIVGDILQSPAATTPAGKSPFAVFTMMAKTKALQAKRFQESPALPADSLYELHFGAMQDFGQQDAVRSSDGPQEGFAITGVERRGDQLFLDFSAAPDVFGLRVVGTDSLAEGFTDDLSDEIIAIPGPAGTGISKVIVDVTGKGPGYFVRIEGDLPDAP